MTGKREVLHYRRKDKTMIWHRLKDKTPDEYEIVVVARYKRDGRPREFELARNWPNRDGGREWQLTDHPLHYRDGHDLDLWCSIPEIPLEMERKAA